MHLVLLGLDCFLKKTHDFFRKIYIKKNQLMEKYSLRRENLIRIVDAFMEILIILDCSIKSIYRIAMVYEFICKVIFFGI